MEAIKQSKTTTPQGWWTEFSPRVWRRRRFLKTLSPRSAAPPLDKVQLVAFKGLPLYPLRAITTIASNHLEVNWLGRNQRHQLLQLLVAAEGIFLLGFCKELPTVTLGGNLQQSQGSQITYTLGRCQILDTRSVVRLEDLIPEEPLVLPRRLQSTEAESMDKGVF